MKYMIKIMPVLFLALMLAGPVSVVAAQKENGIETEDIVVHINGDQITAVISTAGNITQEQERGIRDGLARDFGIEEKNCQLLMGKDEQTTLAGDSASGPFTDGNRISHIENRD